MQGGVPHPDEELLYLKAGDTIMTHTGAAVLARCALCIQAGCDGTPPTAHIYIGGWAVSEILFVPTQAFCTAAHRTARLTNATSFRCERSPV